MAPCGTALTRQQVRLIHKFTDNILLMNDGDSAGIHASLKDIDLILYEGLNVSVVLLPDGEDPDSFSRSHTLEEVQRYMADNERDFLDFKADILLKDAGNNPLKKANFVNDIADTIARIPDAVKRSVYVNSAAEKFGVAPDVIFTRVKTTRDQLLADEARDRQREGNAAASEGPAPAVPVQDAVPEGDAVPPSFNGAYSPENKVLAAVEGDILAFLLQYGSEELQFETDSPYYDPEVTDTVAGFIASAVESTGEPLANSGYRRVYDSYIELYDRGLGQNAIVRSLLDSPDRLLATLAAEFSTRKYNLSVKRLESALTSEQYWLAAFVPKTMLILAERRLQSKYLELKHSLKGADEEAQGSILLQIREIQRRQNKLKETINGPEV